MKRKKNPSKLGKSRKPRKSFSVLTGKVQMTRDGFVFVIVDGQDDDIFVKASKTRHALHGDIVKVAVTKEKSDRQRREGEIVEIVEHSKIPFVGILHVAGFQAWVLMQSRTMPYDILIDAEEVKAKGIKSGMKVAAAVDGWDRKATAPFGHIVDVLGKPGDNDTEMHAILTEFGLPYRFEPDVEKEAASIKPDITPDDIKGRRDFRDTFTFTIDPADAKDFDDALSYKPLDNGLIAVGVHIADVSYYVKPDTLIDKEAQARGTSVYLVDRTVPMLPEKLSNNLCSLRPGEDKLTFSAVFEMTPKGKVVNRWFGRTIICSDHRLDYDQAQVIIEKAASPSEDYKPEMLDTAISTLWGIAKILREKRFKLGAISFERPEMKVEVDATGKPLRVYQKISKEANWLIEEFMLLANRSVAEFVAAKGKTMVYRIHAEPNEQKIMDLKAFAKNFGYKMGDISNPKAVAGSLNELLDKAKGTPEHDALELLSLRAMSKAIYSTENIGHYGLAFPCYTHFTSPIRRYPDTMVHRLLGLYLDDAKNQSQEYYEKQCKHASEREALAADAERASVKYKLVEFMMDKIGQEFDGTVSGITEWGMYVEIAPTKIEGMVPLREIRSDFFEFDEKRYRLVGKRTHKVFLLGDPVRIRVKDANLEQKLLDYELVEEV